jgi:ABC-type sugar transport system permease subunit
MRETDAYDIRVMFGWTQREIQVASAAVILLLLLIAAIAAAFKRQGKDKQGPWTL